MKKKGNNLSGIFNNGGFKEDINSNGKTKKGLTISKNIVNIIIRMVFSIIKKILLTKGFLFFILIFIGIFIIIIIVFIIVWLIYMLLEDAMALVSLGIGIVGTIYTNTLGQIIGIELKELGPSNINSIPIYKYITNVNKNDYLNELNKKISKETDIIKNNSGLSEIFEKYNQSTTDYLLSFFGKDDKNQNFEETKKIIDQLYSLKYSKKTSDFLFFDSFLNPDKYKDNFNDLFNNILKEIKNANIQNGFMLLIKNGEINNSIEFNNYIYKNQFGYFIKPVLNNNSGSGININSGISLNNKLYTSDNKDIFLSSSGGTLIQFNLNGKLNLDINSMLEFFYFKKSISDYLQAYGNDVSDLSSNDLKILTKIEKNKNFTTKEIDKEKIYELRKLLEFKENQFSDYILSKNKNIIKYNILGGIDIGKDNNDINKEIIKSYIKRYYFIYESLSDNGIILTFFYFGLPGLIDSSNTCRITQLYGPSNASSYYPKGLHNGYDFVFTSRKIIAVSDGIVVKNDKSSVLGNNIIIKTNNVSDYNGEKVNFTFEYLHLENSFVSVGDKVYIGQIIGTQGDTGNSQGEHLHISIYPQPIGNSNYYSSENGYFKAIKSSDFFNSIGIENIFKKSCSYGNFNNIGSLW